MGAIRGIDQLIFERDLMMATQTPIPKNLPQLLPQLGDSDRSTGVPADSQPAASEELTETAGDGIRTHDVQLGNPPEPDPNHLPDKH